MKPNTDKGGDLIGRDLISDVSGGDLIPDVQDARNGVPTDVIQLHNIQKTYRTGEVDVHAVRGVSLKIQKGEFVGFMGASGSGKSTMMNILGCLDLPTNGCYLLDGIDVSKLDRNQLADVRNQKIGFVFQSFNLLSRTSALENVELPLFYAHRHFSAQEIRERALEALNMVGLGERAGHHPSQLSGGQQQRVAIARALINHPEVLFADEATGNLDTKTSLEIMGVFQKLNEEGITIVMVTHELDIASYAKRNIIMRDGLVISDEPVRQRLNAVEEIQKISHAEKAIQLDS